MDIFERLKSEGINVIKEMIESEFQESLILDFKADLPHPADPFFSNEGKKLTKTGRKVIAKAASAFANSMGGVLIIGVDCRVIDGIDCAQRMTPISHLDRALSTINNELHSLTVPSIIGIEAISVHDGKNSGIIAVFIPRTERRPHRSNAADARSYFKRSGTSTVEMEHYEIEDAFFSNQSPDLKAALSLRSAGSGGGGAEPGERAYHLYADIVVSNTGGGLAKHLFFQCRESEGVLKGFGRRHELTSVNQVGIVDGSFQVALPFDVFVHPGTKRILEFFPITMFFNSETNQVRIGKIRCDADSDRSLEFNFSIAAEGMRERKQTIKIELSNLIDCGKIPTRGKKDE
tara:strand:+ start:27 stop:1067 length:1041 start_codon:yes stop_codon:yes gene_type:complete